MSNEITRLVNSVPVADEALLRQMIDAADLNVLRLAIYQETRDPELANIRLEMKLIWGGTYFTYVLAQEHQAIVKRKAFAYLSSMPTRREKLPSKAEARELMEMFTGEPLSEAQLNFGYEELAFDDFPRSAEWSGAPPVEALRNFKVIIIGAGVSGISMAVQLQRLGIDFEILERQQEIGGTWALNTYPGARVDIPSANYQYKFEKRYPWNSIYATQKENQEYLIYIARKFGVFDRIRLNVELKEAVWEEENAQWRLKVRSGDGTVRTASCNVLIGATGLFGTPKLPDIPGLGDFQGKILQTTAWEQGYQWSGQRIGLIGNGSSGAQVMPRLAETAKQVTVFQRTPQWILKAEGYSEPLPTAVRWLCEQVPHYWNWYCYNGYYPTVQNRGLFMHDPEWQKKGGAISARNDALKQTLLDYLQEKLGDRPDLLQKSIPSYAPWGRRMVIDSGWYDSLKRDNVRLVTDRIERITARGIRTSDGHDHELDLLVLALGFQTSRFLWPTRYVGRKGLTLEEHWAKDGPRAYLGMVMPGFPNFFMLYGAPNAQPVIGTVSSWSEIWARYISQSIVAMLEGNVRALECRKEICDEYNKALDVEMSTLIWEREAQGSYFINEFGRVGPQNPFDLDSSYTRARRPNLKDYHLIR